jgi:hypothetical protein
MGKILDNREAHGRGYVGQRWTQEHARRAGAFRFYHLQVVKNAITNLRAPLSLNQSSKVDEDIIAPVIGDDEAKPFFVVPLVDGAAAAHDAGVCLSGRRKGNFLQPNLGSSGWARDPASASAPGIAHFFMLAHSSRAA